MSDIIFIIIIYNVLNQFYRAVPIKKDLVESDFKPAKYCSLHIFHSLRFVTLLYSTGMLAREDHITWQLTDQAVFVL